MESDELEIDHNRQEAILTGNVYIHNDTGSIRANRIEVRYDEEIDEVQELEAFGEVEFTWLHYEGESDYLRANVPEETALLRGNAWVRQAGAIIRAEAIHIDHANNRVRFVDDVSGEYDPEKVSDDPLQP